MTVYVGLHDTTKLGSAVYRRVSRIVPHPGKSQFCFHFSKTANLPKKNKIYQKYAKQK